MYRLIYKGYWSQVWRYANKTILFDLPCIISKRTTILKRAKNRKVSHKILSLFSLFIFENVTFHEFYSGVNFFGVHISLNRSKEIKVLIKMSGDIGSRRSK